MRRSLAFLLLVSCASSRPDVLDRFELVAGPLPGVSRRVPLDLQIHGETRLEKYTRKTVSFAAEEGDRVPAFLLVPHEPQARAPAMLCLHQTTKIGKREPAGMGLKNLAYAAELAERGFVTLAPDYPNFGDYTVDAYARGYASATMKGIWNHMRAIDLLQSLPEVDPGRIGAIGHSLGGHNAIFVASFDPRIRVVVSSCGFNAFPKYMKGDLKGWSHKGYMPRIAELYGADAKRMPFDFPDLVRALAPRALFINAPLGDSNFEVSGVRDCVEAARPVYASLGAADRLVAVHPDCGHDFPKDVRDQAYAFVENVLRK